jgi:hypothetical protein
VARCRRARSGDTAQRGRRGGAARSGGRGRGRSGEVEEARSGDTVEEGKEQRHGGGGRGVMALWRRQGVAARWRMATTQSEGEGVTARSRLGEFTIEGVRS